MKLGIIGAGTIVESFLPQLVALEGLEVKGILDIPAKLKIAIRLCEKHGIVHAVDSFDELTALEIDTVYVAVPNNVHYAYCKLALERGLHVIVEKPMTANYREACELVELAKDKRLFFFEAVPTPYMGGYLKIKEWLPRIGNVKLVECHYTQYSRRYNAFRLGEVLPVFDPAKAGGAMMDINLYNLHYVIGLFGSPKQTYYYANIERSIDTSGTIILEYDGFHAVCIAAKDSKSGIMGGLIQGTDGYIQSEQLANKVGKVILKLNDGTIEEFDDGMAFKRATVEFAAFLNMIKNNDFERCYEMLQESLEVSKVQTTARKQAGIVFPTDK